MHCPKLHLKTDIRCPFYAGTIIYCLFIVYVYLIYTYLNSAIRVTAT